MILITDKQVRRRRAIDKTLGRDHVGGLRVKEGNGGIFTTRSTANKGNLVAALEHRDRYVVNKCKEQPEWRTAPSYTPEGKKNKRDRERETGAAKRAEKPTNATPNFVQNDQVRLAIIMFDDTFYSDMLRSEQPPETRAEIDAGKMGKGKDLWRRVAAAMCDPRWEVPLPIECSVEDDDPPDLVAKLGKLDLKASAEKWLNVWTCAANGVAKDAQEEDTDPSEEGDDPDDTSMIARPKKGSDGTSSTGGKGCARKDAASVQRPEDVGKLVCHAGWKKIQAGYRVSLGTLVDERAC